jgi:hypothetical protein
LKEFQFTVTKKEEDFPDLGEAIDPPKKKTKKQLKDEETKMLQAQKHAEIEALPHKGKPASFFQVKRDSVGNFFPTIDQLDFILLYYMAYADPEDMEMLLEWLYNHAT